MSDTQANSIRDLLIAAINAYDPSIDLKIGSSAYTKIVEPIYNALSPDMFDTDLDVYLLSVLRENYPSLELQDGDAIVDLLVKPLRLILEPLKTELNLLKKRQSTAYVNQMTIQDAEDLASNFFVTRHSGSRSRGIVRVLLSSPTFLTITDQVRFSTVDGLKFYPIRQEFINAETVALQRVGNLYYVDISVIAEVEGDDYNIAPGSISVVQGIPNYVSVNNADAFEQGAQSETKAELLNRVEESLTERSLTSRRGITARIRDEFPTIRSVSIIGYGDPEMERDILVGQGDGSLIASGMSFILGRYVFMVTGFEDSVDGNKLPAAGDKIRLNFWKFMYTTSSVETNEIQEVIYCSYGDAPDLPSVHILLLKEDIQRQPLENGYLPGVFLGVFSAIFSESTLTISDVPVGIEDDTGLLPMGINSNEIHIGGKYDVWVRPKQIESSSSNISILKSAYVDEDVSVFFDGAGQSTLLDGQYPLNRAGLPYYLTLPSHSLYVREPIRGVTSQAIGFIDDIQASDAYITCRFGSFKVGEQIEGLYSGNTTTITAITFEAANKKHIESVLTTTSPASSYFIVDVFENYYILSSEQSSPAKIAPGYIHKKTGVSNVFDPVFKVYPEVASYSTALQTFVGRPDVEVSHDLLSEGVNSGDVLEILSREDTGKYSIVSVEVSTSNLTQLTLDTPMSRTNSKVRFRIIREEAPLAAPLLRINPAGITQTSNAGAGFTIPYKKPIGAYALGAFSGSIARYEGLNGFVLPNMSELFQGRGAGVDTLLKKADPAFLSLFSNAKVDDCITEGCTVCDTTSIPITCTVTIDGSPTSYSAVKFYVSGLISQGGREYLKTFKAWLLSIVDSFFRGVNSQNQAIADDLEQFINQFAPISFGEPDPTNPSEHILYQFEMCAPLELFDGCNNSYFAIPEFIWDSEFLSVDSFAKAITEFLSGRMKANPTALAKAKPGDSLQIKSGANKGEYVIDKVFTIPWYHGDTVATETTVDEQGNSKSTASIVHKKAYEFTIVIIRGEFPNETLKGSSSYFRNALPTVSSILPNIPTSTLSAIHTVDIATGQLKDPFDVIQEAYTVLFKSMYAQGFDLPEEFSLQPGPVLTKITKSFFSSYCIGNRSPQQTTRMLFQDPIDTTVYSAKKCSSITWRKEVKTAASLVATTKITLPIASLSGAEMTLFTSVNASQDSETLTGTISDDLSAEEDIELITSLIQDALDPARTRILVTYEVINAPTEHKFTISLLSGGQGSYIKADVTSGLQHLGFTVEELVEGKSAPSPTEETTKKIKGHNGTRFSLTQQKVNRALVVDIQDTEDFYHAVMPRRSASFELQDIDLQRDGLFSAHYLDAESCNMYFTDANDESAFESGIRPGDLLYVYEQVCTLDNTGLHANPFNNKKDRVLHVKYDFSLKTISLLSTAGTFLTPESTNNVGESPEEDVVNVGDIVFFEAADTTARVVSVSETSLRIDKEVSMGLQPTAIQHGHDGSIQHGTEFKSVSQYVFTDSDVGYYLVLYGSENEGVDGTYTIESVTAGMAVLAETISSDETALHWILVKPSFDEVGSSSVGGFNDTIGVTPIRIYRGAPRKLVVGDTSHFLARERSSIEVLYGDLDGGPRRGFKQPFKVVRPHEYRITANQMMNQGMSCGFYYFDVPTTTLTPTFDLNIPENTQYTPVVTTMKTKGYDLVVSNRAHVFSTREKTELVLDSSYIPSAAGGSIAETQSPEGATLSILYETSTEAITLQAFLENDANRNLCSDPLVKHYLPSYVYLEIASSAANETAQEAVMEYINGLSPTDSIRLSDIEKQLHASNIDIYDHPIFIHCLTYDLNRNVVLTRTNNLVDDSTILHDGTNRITYYIATSDSIKIGETF